MKNLMLAPLVLLVAGLSACTEDKQPDVVAVPVAVPVTQPAAPDPIVVPSQNPIIIEGPKGEKGDTGEKGEKGEQGDTTVPVIIEQKAEEPMTTSDDENK